MDAATLDGVRRRATAWLLEHQHASGPWMLRLKADEPVPSVAMTVLALNALQRVDDTSLQGVIDGGTAWLAEQQNDDGSFGEGERGRFYRPYCTGLALWTLPATDAERYAGHIAKAIGYLRDNQSSSGVDFGGIGYGMVGSVPTPEDPGRTFTRNFATISPTSMAADGMRKAGVGPDDPFWQGIIHYVRSCHNDPKINNSDAVAGFLEENAYCLSGDGGVVATMENFRRTPEQWAAHGDAAPEPIISSGNSTYQAIRTYVRAGLGADSPEITSAMEWVRRHYSVTEHVGFADIMRAGQRPLWLTEHPGFEELEHRTVLAAPPRRSEEMGLTGLYLYLYSMAQALHELGVRSVQTADGIEHDWVADIATELHASQHPEGFWVNENPRWFEFDAVLSTSSALSTVNILANYLPVQAT